MKQLVDRFGNPLEYTEPSVIAEHIESKKIITDARQTIDEDRLGSSITNRIISIEDDNSWTLLDIDDEHLVNYTKFNVLDKLANQHPDIGRALWEMHNNLITQWSWQARGVDGEEDPAGTEVLRRASEYLEVEIDEPVEVKLGQLVDSGFLRDHWFTETVFEGEEFLDIRVIDPVTAKWQRRDNPEGRGQHWVLGQEQLGQFIELDTTFIRFTPVIPQVSKPYGRSVWGTAVYPMVFLLGLIKSAKKVIDTQAWPNRVATISRETLAKSGMPPNEIEDLVKKLNDKVTQDMEKAGKGSQFIWDGAVALEIVGGMGRVNLDAIDMMERILERWIIRALKQYPILFAIDSGNSLSTNAEQQSEQFANATDSLLRRLEAIFNYHGNNILKHRFGGSYQGRAVFEMKRNNAIVRKFRTEAFNIQNKSFIDLHTAGAISTAELRRVSMQADLDTLNILSSNLEEELPPELLEKERLALEAAQAAVNNMQANNESESDSSDNSEEE